MRNKSKSRPDHSKVDWRNLAKDGESFRKFKFFSARFEFSKLTNCNFSAVSAKRSCFIKADLSGSDFTGANLEGANFGGANLTNVNFKGAALKHTNFQNATVVGANFLNTNIKMAKKLKLSDAQIREIEEANQAQKDRTAADLAARKAKKAAESIQ